MKKCLIIAVLMATGCQHVTQRVTVAVEIPLNKGKHTTVRVQYEIPPTGGDEAIKP